MTAIESPQAGGRLPKMREFWRRFCRDRRGNYALVTAVAMVPLMGAVAMAVDFSELNRQKQMVMNALDAANFAAARRLAEGVAPVGCNVGNAMQHRRRATQQRAWNCHPGFG